MVDKTPDEIANHFKNLSIAKELGDKVGEGQVYCHLSEAFYRSKDFKKSLEYSIKGLSVVKEIGDKSWEGRIYGSLGHAFYRLGNFKQAVNNHTKDLCIAKEMKDRAAEGRAYGNLGNAHNRLNNFSQAIEFHKLALSIAQEVGDKSEEGNAYGNLGAVYDGLGNFKQAIEYHMKHLSFAKELGDKIGERRAYGNLGNAFYRMSNFQQAIEYHSKYLSIAIEIGERVAIGRAYGSLGNDYRGLGNFEKASEYGIKSFKIFNEMRDDSRVGDAGWGGKSCKDLALGVAFHKEGDFKQAIEHLKKHLCVVKQLGDRAQEGDTCGILGDAYHKLGEFKQAITYHNQALSIAKAMGDKAKESTAYSGLGNAYHSLGSFQQAIEYHSKDLRISKDLGDRGGEGTAYGNLGIAYYRLGNFKQAEEYHNQQLSIAKEVGDRAREGLAFGNLGNAYERLGLYKRAIECHNQCLSIAKELGDRAREGGAYGNLSICYHSLGDSKQAIECATNHLRIAKEIGDKNGKKNAQANLGNAYYQLGEFKHAITHYEQTLSLAKELGDKAGEGTAYGSIGNAYEGLRNFKQAIEYLNKHVSIAKELGDRAGDGRTYCNLGNAYHNLGDLEKAIEYHSLDLNSAKKIGDKAGEGIACYSLGLDFEKKGSFSEAKAYYQSSIRLFNDTRALLESKDYWKIHFRHRYRDAYTALWRTLLKNGETDEALCAAEQGRAQALTDLLKEQYGIHALPPISFSPKETISSVLHESSTQTVFMALDQNTINYWITEKGTKIQFKQKAIEDGSASQLMERFLKKIGAGVDVRCENRSLDELSDEPTSERKAVVADQTKSAATSVNSLRSLFHEIIGPVADMLQDDQLIVVPDGALCFAPYSALTESVRITTIPSLTALKLITASPKNFHSNAGALLVGDPAVDQIPKKLEQLLYARREVEMIAKLLNITPLTGRDATKSEVLKRISSVALVHIAAHGGPETGEIVLAPNVERASQIPKEEDYLLTMADVQAVRLKARLVVLSSCQSGRGEVKSEGVVGIARAFLCAGARCVLVSLWAIDDEATMLFMECFYKQLADGKRASLALYQAMKSLRETQQFSAEKYWAPFVLIGDDVTLECGEAKW